MKARKQVFVWVLLALLAACGVKPLKPATATPPPTKTPLPTSTALPKPAITLRVWLPPVAGMERNSPAAELLFKRINAFAAMRGVKAEIRLKPLTGPAGMLPTLSAARAVAPDAVPDVVLMPRYLMEEAVANGLAFPLPDDAFATPLSTGDWFGYAQQMAAVESVTYGVPFAGDALGLVYKPTDDGPAPATWQDWLNTDREWEMPLGDPKALALFALYKSAGGSWGKSAASPSLDEDTLAKVFALLKDAQDKGLIDRSLLSIQDDQTLWSRYQSAADAFIVTRVSHLLAMPQPRLMAPIPGQKAEQRLIVSDALLWALTTPDSHRQKQAIALLAYLSAPSFVAQWTETAGFLPPQRQELESWHSAVHRNLISELIPFMEPPPPHGITSRYGPTMVKALDKVLAGRQSPQEAAHWVLSEAKPATP